MKATLLTNSPAPYRTSFFDSWSRLDDILVVFDAESSAGRSWKLDPEKFAYRFKVVNSSRIHLNPLRRDHKFREKHTLYISTGVIGVLRAEKPRVVVSAEMGFRTILAALWCKWSGTPLVIWTEVTPHTERFCSWLRRQVRRRLVASADRFWTNGKDSADYLRRLGAPADKILEGMTGVDTGLFVKEVAKRMGRRQELRERLGFEGVSFLVLGSLSGRKGMSQFRNAVMSFAKERPGMNCTFVMLGNGPELETTKAWANTLPEGIKIVFPGFVQIDGVPDYIAAADWGLMPTLEDCWPLSTLEMLLGGLPQLFSRYNGATSELCREGVTGHAFDPVNPDDFVDTLQKAVNHVLPRLPVEIVKEFADFYSPDAQAARAHSTVLALAGQPASPAVQG